MPGGRSQIKNDATKSRKGEKGKKGIFEFSNFTIFFFFLYCLGPKLSTLSPKSKGPVEPAGLRAISPTAQLVPTS